MCRKEETLRVQHYSRFFAERENLPISDEDINTYLEQVGSEENLSIKSWAMGFLIECGLLTEEQLLRLRSSPHLEEKHYVFLDREIANLQRKKLDPKDSFDGD